MNDSAPGEKGRSYMAFFPFPLPPPPSRSQNYILFGNPRLATVLLNDPWRVLLSVIPFPQVDHGQCRSVLAHRGRVPGPYRSPGRGTLLGRGAANSHQSSTEEIPQSLTPKRQRICCNAMFSPGCSKGPFSHLSSPSTEKSRKIALPGSVPAKS